MCVYENRYSIKMANSQKNLAALEMAKENSIVWLELQSIELVNILLLIDIITEFK